MLGASRLKRKVFREGVIYTTMPLVLHTDNNYSTDRGNTTRRALSRKRVPAGRKVGQKPILIRSKKGQERLRKKAAQLLVLVEARTKLSRSSACAAY